MIASRVLETIRRHALVAPGGRVVVALSGGSDSVALLRAAKELEGRGELVVAAAVHLNHGLRAEASGDEQFCRELAADMASRFAPISSTCAGARGRERTSLEAAGRNARYELFERVADEFGAAAIATGHTRNDQAETFLLRLLRGAGPRGLGGIHPRAGRVIRPLIDLDRDDLREYLSSLGQAFREDDTNADLTIPRNRIRHELLPLLESRYAPGIVDVLARDASIAREDEDHLRREAIDLTDSIVLTGRPDAGASGEHGRDRRGGSGAAAPGDWIAGGAASAGARRSRPVLQLRSRPTPARSCGAGPAGSPSTCRVAGPNVAAT